MPRFGRTPVLALVAGLSGCAAQPQSGTLPETPTPATWSSERASPAEAASLAQWWLRFDDPLLATLVTQALQANTSVRTAQAALQQARAVRDGRAANLLPVVNGSAADERVHAGGTPTSTTFRTGFDASWELDVFGARRSARDAAEGDAQAAQTSLADVQVSIAAEVAVTYVEMRGQQARLAIAQSNLASQTETQ